MFNTFQQKLKKELENIKSNVPNIVGLKSFPINGNEMVNQHDLFSH